MQREQKDLETKVQYFEIEKQKEADFSEELDKIKKQARKFDLL